MQQQKLIADVNAAADNPCQSYKALMEMKGLLDAAVVAHRAKARDWMTAKKIEAIEKGLAAMKENLPADEDE